MSSGCYRSFRRSGEVKWASDSPGGVGRGRESRGVSTTMHNVEFKCELRDIALARGLCAAVGAVRTDLLEQTDTYFRVPTGRLKRREVPGNAPEYIAYERADRTQPKLSHFTIYTENEAVERFGVRPLPIWTVVRKRREVWMWRNVRIHLDEVQGLGTFLEMEALVSPAHPVPRCHEAIAELRSGLGPALGEAIAVGYADMLGNE